MVFIQIVDTAGAMWYANSPSGFYAKSTLFLGIKPIWYNRIVDKTDCG